MRLALVRGYQASPYELQTFLPLASMGVALTTFTSRRGMFPLPSEANAVKLASPKDRRADGGGLVAKAQNYALWRLGMAGNGLEGLEEALGGHGSAAGPTGNSATPTSSPPFDVVHAMETSNQFTLQSLDATRQTGAPLVVTVWENIPFRAGPANRVHLEAEAFVAVTELARAALVLEGAPDDRIHSIPVGIDLSRFTPGRNDAWRTSHGIPADAPVFLFAARMVWEKGLLDVLHAFKLLQRRNPGGPAPHLVVVGGGDPAPYKQRVAWLGLQANVHILGGVPYTQMPDIYRACDALVLASLPTPLWQEQYGMVLVEAMAMGLAVVTTRSGSIPEVVGDCAVLAQPGDAMDLAAAMGKVLEASHRERLVRDGKERAKARYDATVVAKQMLALYRSLGVKG